MRRTVGFAGALALAFIGTAFAGFGPPQNVSNNPGESAVPSVALDAALSQFVVWADNTDDSGSPDVNFRLRFVEFPAGGPAPASSTVIPGVVALDESLFPRAAVDGGGVLHVVFQNKVLSRYDVFYASYDGIAWSAPVNVSTNPGDSLTPAIAVDATNQVHAVWADDTEISGVTEVFYAKRSALGVWSVPQNISRRTGSVSAFPDVVATSDGRPNVVWIDTTSGVKSVFFTRGSGGSAFSTSRNISGELGTGPIGDTGPAIAVGVADRLHVVWAGVASAEGSDIFYQTAAGPVYGFTRPRAVTVNAGASIAPRIAADSVDQAHVVWADNTVDPDYDILYAKVFASGGGTQPEVVEATPGRSLLPDIRVDATDSLRVCWQDDLGIPPAVNFEILCADAGESIPPVTTPVTSPQGDPTCGGWIQSNSVGVTLTAVDNSGAVASITYRQDSGSPTTVNSSGCPGPTGPFSTSFTHTGQGNHRIRFFAEDCDGNVEAEKETTFKTDNVPPVTTAVLNGSCSGNCPIFNEPVQIVLSATDPAPGSGVESTTFSLDGGPATAYTGSFEVAADGIHTVTFFSEDVACNVEAQKSLQFEIRRPLVVEITRPKKGVLYVNNVETAGPVAGFSDMTLRLGETSVTIAQSALIAGGGKLTVQAKVTTPDGSMVEQVQFYVNGVLRSSDGTDRLSGSTYTFQYTPASLSMRGTDTIKVVALDKSSPVRKGSAEINVVLAR